MRFESYMLRAGFPEFLGGLGYRHLNSGQEASRLDRDEFDQEAEQNGLLTRPPYEAEKSSPEYRSFVIERNRLLQAVHYHGRQEGEGYTHPPFYLHVVDAKQGIYLLMTPDNHGREKPQNDWTTFQRLLTRQIKEMDFLLASGVSSDVGMLCYAHKSRLQAEQANAQALQGKYLQAIAHGPQALADFAVEMAQKAAAQEAENRTAQIRGVAPRMITRTGFSVNGHGRLNGPDGEAVHPA